MPNKSKRNCLYCGKTGELHKDEFDAWQCDKCKTNIENKLKEVIILHSSFGDVGDFIDENTKFEELQND